MKGDPEPSFTLGFGVFSPLVVTVVNLTWKSKKNVVFISVEVAVTPGGGVQFMAFCFFFLFQKSWKKFQEISLNNKIFLFNLFCKKLHI